MNCAEVMDCLNGLCPLEYALDWDNVGLLVGSLKKDVKTVYIAVDATDEIVADAAEKKVDMLITHHPLIFSKMNRVVEDDFVGRRVMDLIRNDISYAAMHTNFDVCTMGYEAADRLGLKKSEVLEVTNSLSGEKEGIGRIGELSYEQSLRDVCVMVKRTFNLENVKVFGDLDTPIINAAICPGSGKSVVDVAVSKGAQVLISGDIDHHTGIDALMQGLSIIDAGHYGIEKIFVQVIYEYLSRTTDLKIYCENIKESFSYV